MRDFDWAIGTQRIGPCARLLVFALTLILSTRSVEGGKMVDRANAFDAFENAWNRWHRAQAALKPHFVAGEIPPDEKLDELERAVEDLERAKEHLADTIK